MLNKKKLIVFILTFLPISITLAEPVKISLVSAYIDGMWGKWVDMPQHPYRNVSGIYVSEVYMTGYYNNFVIYPGSYHPSNYYIRVRFEGTVPEPNAKERRRRMREDEWYEFKGTIELRWAVRWMYEEENKKLLSRWETPITAPGLIDDDDGMAKYSNPIKIPATIKIAPYKKRPNCYNIFFDLKSGESFGIAFVL